MSFFSRKPNPPPLPPRVAQVLNKPNAAPPPPARPAGQNVPVTAAENQQRMTSNTRFRSFCERYVVERCRDWPQDQIEARAWEAILEARSIYNKVKEVGRTIGDDT